MKKIIYTYKLILIYMSYKKYSTNNKMKNVFQAEIKRSIIDIIKFV